MSKSRRYMDIHTHILPGVDDGAKNIDETMEMVELAYKEGIRIIMATPHYGAWNPEYDKAKAIAACRKVREYIKARYNDMNIYIGNEIYYNPGIVEDLKAGKALTLGGTSYVLVEFAVDESYKMINSGLRSFIMEGYRPVIAHIERYRCLQNDMDRVKELVEMGAYVQVNARSFLSGRFDKRAAKRTAWCTELLQNGLVHFIASDCHSCGNRSPIMETAVMKLLELTDKETVYRIVHTNVIKLMQNKYI